MKEIVLYLFFFLPRAEDCKIYHADTTRPGLAVSYTVKVKAYMRQGVEPNLEAYRAAGDPPIECFDVFRTTTTIAANRV